MEINLPLEYYNSLRIPDRWRLAVMSHEMRMWIDFEEGMAVKTMFEEDGDGARWLSIIIETCNRKPRLIELHYVQKYWAGSRICVMALEDDHPEEKSKIVHMVCCLDEDTSVESVRKMTGIPDETELELLIPESLSC